MNFQGDFWTYFAVVVIMGVLAAILLDLRAASMREIPHLEDMSPTNLGNLFRLPKEEYDPLEHGRAWIGQEGEFYEVTDWRFTTVKDKLAVTLRLQGHGWVTCPQLLAPIWYVKDRHDHR